jgi:hypothetical protein
MKPTSSTKFDPNDNSTESTWYITFNHPGRPEHGKKYKVHTIRMLDSHSKPTDKYGMQFWGMASESGTWQDRTSTPFDTGWGDKLEQEIHDNNLVER